jgi:hypothetical protein
MIHRLHRFFDSPPHDRRLIVQAAVLVTLIRVGLWLLPFRLLHRILSGMVGAGPRVKAALAATDDVDRVAQVVKAVSRYVPSATCLTQAMAAQVLLRQRGVAARLHIGVQKEDSHGLMAHAWVESQGRVVVGGPRVNQFVPLLVLDGETP